jgi:hypothetical protein
LEVTVTQKKSTPLLKPGRKPGPKLTFVCQLCTAAFEVTPARARISGGVVPFCGNACKQIHARARAYDRLAINARFWTKILCGLTPDACWEWLGATRNFGYGHFAYGPRGDASYVAAHIYSFMLHGGVLTTEKPCVLHSCDNPPCANPRHLFAGTKKDNTQDMMSKGRHRYILPVR